jgi:hypothetical protein
MAASFSIDADNMTGSRVATPRPSAQFLDTELTRPRNPTTLRIFPVPDIGFNLVDRDCSHTLSNSRSMFRRR